jgi:hypothetical protein
LFQNSALTMKGAKNQLGDGYRIYSGCKQILLRITFVKPNLLQ